MLTIIPSTEVPPPDPEADMGLLGPFLPVPPGLVLLSGETSAGKTVLVYNIALHLAQGTEFVGLTPPRPLRVIYIDLETPEQLHRGQVETIGRSDNLAFVRTMPNSLNSTSGMADLTQAIRDWKAEVIIIDPLPVAWPLVDENDNAEASRQMAAIKELAVQTSSIILTLWNMGEGQVKEKFRARGATARLDRADLGLNYDEIAQSTRRLKVAVSRYGTRGESITLRFAGELGFEVVASDDISIASKFTVIKAKIKELLGIGELSRKDILDGIKNAGIVAPDNLVDKALGEMVNDGEIVRTGRGVYAIP